LSYNGSKFDDLVLANNIFRYCKHNYTIEKFFDLIQCIGFFDLYTYMRTYYLERDIVCPRDIHTDRPSLTLSNCVRRLCHEELDNAHDAEADCRAMYKIMQRLDSKMHLMTLLVDMKSIRTFIDALPFVMRGKGSYRTLTTIKNRQQKSPHQLHPSHRSTTRQGQVEKVIPSNESIRCEHVLIPHAFMCMLCNSILYP
jgi:hypothetical protein